MSEGQTVRLQAGSEHQAATEEALQRLVEGRFVARLWEADESLWSAADGAGVADKLGWLTVPEDVGDQLEGLAGFVEEVRAQGFKHAVLLGMGGSSLTAEVLCDLFEPRPGYLSLRVLDSTDPAAVLGVQEEYDLGEVLFMVASKSGETTETVSFCAYFLEQLRNRCGDLAGRHFVAITDEGSPLQELALEQDFRAVFANPPDIVGRYSALSFFGLVPAALMGLDLAQLTQAAAAAGHASREEDENSAALRLGAILGGLAAHGRNKLTILSDPKLAPFGAWIEQLLAESTGKRGTGILPVNLEPVVDAALYGDDRLFVLLQLDSGPAGKSLEALVVELVGSGHPVVTVTLPSRDVVGAAFMEWQIAASAAAWLLGVNAFDQPDVRESVENMKLLLEAHTSAGDLPVIVWASMPDGAPGCVKATHPELLPRALRSLITSVGPHEYVSLQAYVAPSAAVWAGLEAMRRDLSRRLHVATTAGYGPRFLYRTGQFHKGGPRDGVFIQLVADDERDALIPDQPFSFSVLKRAQADGDLRALRRKGLRALRVELGLDVPGNLALLVSTLRQVLLEAETAAPEHRRGSRG